MILMRREKPSKVVINIMFDSRPSYVYLGSCDISYHRMRSSFLFEYSTSTLILHVQV